jgi:hypothetical protein
MSVGVPSARNSGQNFVFRPLNVRRVVVLNGPAVWYVWDPSTRKFKPEGEAGRCSSRPLSRAALSTGAHQDTAPVAPVTSVFSSLESLEMPMPMTLSLLCTWDVENAQS